MSSLTDLFCAANRQRCIALLKQGTPLRPKPKKFVESSVIIPLCYYDNEPAILYTKRTMRVRHSPGDVSFPGGRMDPGETPIAAALRELEEEVGIPCSFVDVWTTFAPCPTRSKLILIHPVVGFCGYYNSQTQMLSRDPGNGGPHTRLKPSDYEVDAVIFRSVEWLSRPRNRNYCLFRENPLLPFTGVTSFLGNPNACHLRHHGGAVHATPVFGWPPGICECPKISGVTAILTYQFLSCLLPEGLPKHPFIPDPFTPHF
ncbi:unnamed protein product [Mesocestoides corti]|uniref:Nudix hydrolase domain-containing protein n=1 Tax=Mesocestoides corti TaxID=53468 RepID=A0A0R3U4U3_MESCO|nr:unnamed protein product [Mesocestoides corti]